MLIYYIAWKKKWLKKTCNITLQDFSYWSSTINGILLDPSTKYKSIIEKDSFGLVYGV
jgi:hypothetical protein